MIHELIVGVMLLIGSTLMLFAAIGLLRFSDVLCRSHALAKATTFGICMMLIALWVSLNEDVTGLKILLVISFSLLTIPLASHLIALLVYRMQEELRQSQAEQEKKKSGADNTPT
jgi:multicomponent Na+:H+ antiporter subunit G